jgi:hypothetical protein
MTTSTLISPNHKAIKTYHAELQEISIQSDKEGAVSAAFHRLLADTAKVRGWTLVGQVVRVSVEMVMMVNALPEGFGG